MEVRHEQRGVPIVHTLSSTGHRTVRKRRVSRALIAFEHPVMSVSGCVDIGGQGVPCSMLDGAVLLHGGFGNVVRICHERCGFFAEELLLSGFCSPGGVGLTSELLWKSIRRRCVRSSLRPRKSCSRRYIDGTWRASPLDRLASGDCSLGTSDTRGPRGCTRRLREWSCGSHPRWPVDP